MDDQKRGEEIMQAVFKASMQALFSIGVKSPEYVDKFTLNFSEALDREFLKIGLFQPQTEAQQDSAVGQAVSQDVGPDISSSIKDLKLQNFIIHHLKKAGITTIEELMTRMQQEALTDIKGIKEKSAKQILEALSLWQTSS